MRIEYDRRGRRLIHPAREASVDDNIDIEDGVTVDLDEKKHIVEEEKIAYYLTIF